jgi:hypothetical protein
MRERIRDDLSGVLLVSAVAGLLCLTVVNNGGVDLRHLSTALGVAVFALLTWRVVGSWQDLTDLERVLAVLLAVSPLASAVAALSLQTRVEDLPDNPWLWTVLVHRLLCVGVVVHWRRLFGRGRDRGTIRG